MTGLGTVQVRHSFDIRHGYTQYSVLLNFNSFFVGNDWQGLKFVNRVKFVLTLNLSDLDSPIQVFQNHSYWICVEK